MIHSMHYLEPLAQTEFTPKISNRIGETCAYPIKSDVYGINTISGLLSRNILFTTWIKPNEITKKHKIVFLVFMVLYLRNVKPPMSAQKSSNRNWLNYKRVMTFLLKVFSSTGENFFNKSKTKERNITLLQR